MVRSIKIEGSVAYINRIHGVIENFKSIVKVKPKGIVNENFNNDRVHKYHLKLVGPEYAINKLIVEINKV